MAFLDDVLQPPSYGWKDASGNFSKPTPGTILKEFFSRLNIFKNKKNWLSFFSWMKVLALFPFFVLFVTKYFSFGLLAAGFVYGMILMGTHGTIWYHRYCTHGAYTFRNSWWKFFTKNLVLSIIPEEIYVVSHHVHHLKSDMPGDPYNSNAGIMYCMLSDVNHQSIAKNLSEEEYKKASHFLSHTGVMINSYAQYLKWGSIANPFYTVGLWILNWSFWYGMFFLIGGHGLACALFSGALFWFVLVRAFNYTGHGGGKVKHVDGIDFDRSNMSINQTRPGLFSGEWHNNHHLYPDSARAGFLPYQIDLAWIYIWTMKRLGAVASYRDSKAHFLKRFSLNNEGKPLMATHEEVGVVK